MRDSVLPALLRTARALPLLALAACSEHDVAAGHGTAPHELTGHLVLTGSSTVAPVAAEIARRFEELHPGVRVDVQSGGSSRGIADALSGTADIGMASRALKEEERAQGLSTWTFAVDGVALFVHTGNPVRSLTDEQVVGIYTGAIERWDAVGGRAREIVVASKAEGRATLEVFLGYFGLDIAAVHADLIVGENQQAIKTVVGDEDAIAYVSIGEAEREISLGTPIRLLATGGVEATTDNVATGRFPITRPLALVTLGEPAGLAAAFVEFARSALVHDLIEAEQFVPFRG